jgi:hypothetical protein
LAIDGKGHEAPITLIRIDDKTGEISTVSGVYLNLWTINGTLLVSKKTSTSNATITALAASDGYEWLENYCAYITGHEDGSIRVWGWTWEDGKRNLCLRTQLKAHSSSITCLYITRYVLILIGLTSMH